MDEWPYRKVTHCRHGGHTGLIPQFSSPEDSHAHSLATLEVLSEYDDFMLSVRTLADMGCGKGLDLEWWATRTTRDEIPTPLNIRCTGIDLHERLGLEQRYRNIQYSRQDFQDPIVLPRNETFDVVWCHDAFQYVIDPFRVLSQWYQAMSDDAMLVVILPQTTALEFNKENIYQLDGCYHHWSIVSLIHVLAVSGFDCAGGYFYRAPGQSWLHAVVYKSLHEPMDPRTTRWHELADKGLLPESAVAGLIRHGHVRQNNLVLPWLDKNHHWWGQF